MQIKIEASKKGDRWYTIYQTCKISPHDLSTLVERLLAEIIKRNKEG
jgi:hypothetical protein